MAPDPIIQLSALEHHMYCPRQCALIHVEGVWVENRATVEGTRAHRRVDSPGRQSERSRMVVRAVPLYSDRYGLAGRSDGVEIDDNGCIAPVEHKAGVRHGKAADVQLCAQALCLEEMFDCPIPVGYVWYGRTRRKAEVAFDSELRDLTISIIDDVRSNIVNGLLPAPAADDRCKGCQLEPACLPKVVIQHQVIEQYITEEVFGCR
ncbi:MAG: CRISPR-associated protein Cas4 [Acidimicrobiales bacterium]